MRRRLRPEIVADRLDLDHRPRAHRRRLFRRAARHVARPATGLREGFDFDVVMPRMRWRRIARSSASRWRSGTARAALLGRQGERARNLAALARGGDRGGRAITRRSALEPHVWSTMPRCSSCARRAHFDVIITGNLFGDILSDQASMCAGSIGLLPSASLDAEQTGLYEPIHGSALGYCGEGLRQSTGGDPFGGDDVPLHRWRCRTRRSGSRRQWPGRWRPACGRADLGGEASTDRMTEAVLAGLVGGGATGEGLTRWRTAPARLRSSRPDHRRDSRPGSALRPGHHGRST